MTASTGISVNKFIAKIASDFNKPDGITFIGPSKVVSFLEALPIEKFFGVGKVTASKMKSKGIFCGKDLKDFSEEQLYKDFGKAGRFFYHMVRGDDQRPVRANRIAKSIGVEDTYRYDLKDLAEIKEELMLICVKLEKRMSAKSAIGRTLTLKVKYSDFVQVTRGITSSIYYTNVKQLFDAACGLLNKVELEDKRVRLIGLSISNFYDVEIGKSNDPQLTLF